mgnify:CR=1 FL=1
MLKRADTVDLRGVAATILQKEVGVQPCADLQAIFWLAENGDIEWVVGYTAFIGKTCQMHMVNLKGGYTPKGLLFDAFNYAFNECEKEKVFGVVNSLNTKAIDYDKKLGFNEVLRFAGMHDDGGDLVVIPIHFMYLILSNEANGYLRCIVMVWIIPMR